MNRTSIALKGFVAVVLAGLAFGASAAPGRHHGAYKHHHHRHHVAHRGHVGNHPIVIGR